MLAAAEKSPGVTQEAPLCLGPWPLCRISMPRKYKGTCKFKIAPEVLPAPIVEVWRDEAWRGGGGGPQEHGQEQTEVELHPSRFLPAVGRGSLPPRVGQSFGLGFESCLAWPRVSSFPPAPGLRFLLRNTPLCAEPRLRTVIPRGRKVRTSTGSPRLQTTTPPPRPPQTLSTFPASLPIPSAALCQVSV